MEGEAMREMPFKSLVLVAVMALVTAPVFAEEEEAEEEAPAAEDAAGAEAAAKVAAPGAEPGARAEGVYEVKEGDTLWDITKKELQNPWYWPKVWADNPDITNPNWIYPGAKLV